MPVGDVNSTQKGSGARYNDGKPNLSFIPTWIIGDLLPRYRGTRSVDPTIRAAAAMSAIGAWQATGHETHLYDALNQLHDPIVNAARVFEYGAQKYASWNWAKGQPWSVPVACAGRHALAIAGGELIDPPELGGSGLPHEGHIACNIIMLLFFQRTYPEGDDITYAKILPAA